MPNDHESARPVVVTDIRMPFWSMVVFMVKWAIAAIPALLLLAILAAAVTAAFTGVFSSLGRTAFSPTISVLPPPSGAAQVPREAPYPSHVPDRCKGSVELDKCVEQERKLERETPEERAQRQRSLEAARKANSANMK